MKALILNSGLGHRMGELTKTHPKCMTTLYDSETILSRQLKLLSKANINDVVITTGYFDSVLIDYCKKLRLPINFTFVKNPIFAETNYIYSIYCAKDFLNDDILLLHGDIVFDFSVLSDMLKEKRSVMKISTTIKLPEKDFKSVIDKDSKISKVGINYFENSVESQAFYKLNKADWNIWLNEIVKFCENGNRKCYAEEAFNKVSDKCNIYGFDAKDTLCTEIDNLEDLNKVKELLRNGK